MKIDKKALSLLLGAIMIAALIPFQALASSVAINVSASSDAAGTVTGAGTYDTESTTSVTITATANEGYTFVKWIDSEGNTVSTDASYTYPLTEGTTSASFQAVFEGAEEGVLPTGISLNQTSATLTTTGATLQLTATVTPDNAEDKTVTWSSSNEAVATVSETGLVTAVANGTAIITATANGDTSVTATCEITVNISEEEEGITGITLDKTTAKLVSKGATVQLTATVEPETAEDKTVSWSTSNEAVATVSETGLVTAVANGTATITATANGDTSITATCEVTVAIDSGSSSSGGGGGGSSSSGSSGIVTTSQATTAIREAEAGDSIVVDMRGSTVLPSNAIEALSGKDVTIELIVSDYVRWFINGLDVPAGSFSSINMGVDLNGRSVPNTAIKEIKDIVGKNLSHIQFSLRHNGDFGFEMTMRFEVGLEYAGLYGNLYYYNKSAGKLDFVKAERIDSNGRVNFPFEHASEYVIVMDTESHEDISDKPQSTVDESGNPFADVSESDWFYNDVMFVYGEGIMVGMTDDHFMPQETSTRAMIAAVLHRLEGSSKPSVTGVYSDVAQGEWYSDAVLWASETGIYAGFEDGTFLPNQPITREQLASVLYRYAQSKGSVSATGDLSTFADGDEVSSWAQEAMQWAVGNGLISGRGNNDLAAQATASRAEIASILNRFLAN